ncbi:MAG TPA: alginate lyase family protein, partial [Candidatus Binatia bacterium]|nr:alginate lyase family protein [Candidatus Binatia bacterium]
RVQSGDGAFLAARRRLERDADNALRSPIFSVTQKQTAPPSGDKHDYLSLAPYWWRNPNTSNGLPYVRRDGEVNPERDGMSDRKRLDDMIQTVTTLAAAYFFTDDERYAVRAAKLLRVWFVDDATKMNPHLRYAQAVPGHNQGRAAGIIETHNLPELIDAVGLLKSSPAWAKNDQVQLQNWFTAYLNWLIESPEGKAESKAQNNHGSWYDVQISSYAIFVGRDELAKHALGAFAAERIAGQIEPDGSQPRELARTQSWHYAIFNLEAMFDTATIGNRLGIDLWDYRSTDQRGIRKALDWLAPFAAGERTWSYKQLLRFQPEKLAPLLRRAALRYREPAYEKMLIKLPNLKRDERWQLLFATVPASK